MATSRLRTIAELEKGMTPKQVKLARALAAGGIPKVQAYREVYDWKGKSKNALQVKATEACGNGKVAVLATAIREGETARLWDDRKRFQNWILKGITETAETTDSAAIRLKAYELAGKTHHAKLYVEDAANDANSAIAGSMVDLIGAKLQSLLSFQPPMLGDSTPDTTLDADFNPIPSDATTTPEDPTGGGEGV